jgi:four helix bundle protein
LIWYWKLQKIEQMNTDLYDSNPVLKHSFEFSLMILDYCEMLQQEKKFVLGNQILKCGTSIGANITEAQNAESKADFIHKMKIAAKEAGETQYWLRLCTFSKNYPECMHLIHKLEQIQKLLGKIISTSKRKHPFSYLLSLFG